ncbi:MAG: Mn-Zn_transporter_SitD [uncultured Thermomicrobiales bacterium]|uniref:Mn-Zn_transporter_SitD n=1 Tax=uncultured Thermomicrobiales bacterium TaxID=1645740 RepID=A0A6J4UB70_9BACT|nr:MAG: Mn-Zn_transporter_SitD [uncultured Thermomicrobiales bacterium]
MSFAAIIILTGALTAISCALVGSFLVLRRTAMVGDAISHSVLLGIVTVFWLTNGSRNEILMVLGAGTVGLLTVYLIELVRSSGRVREDAAIGLVFPVLFSIGVIMVSRFPQTVHIDVQHVLYGEIAFAPLRRLELFGADLGYRSLWVLGGMAAINLAFVTLFYKELKLSTFDRGLAATLGFAPLALHYALMGLVSATTVVAFDSVGAILVVAMLIVPGATAYLLTDRLGVMIALACGVGALSAWGGYVVASAYDASISGAMATVAGGILVLAVLGSPRHGVVVRAWTRARLRRRFDVRLLVAHLAGGSDPDHLSEQFRWSPSTVRRTLDLALREGYVERRDGDRLTVTPAGAALAAGTDTGR